MSQERERSFGGGATPARQGNGGRRAERGWRGLRQLQPVRPSEVGRDCPTAGRCRRSNAPHRCRPFRRSRGCFLGPVLHRGGGWQLGAAGQVPGLLECGPLPHDGQPVQQEERPLTPVPGSRLPEFRRRRITSLVLRPGSNYSAGFLTAHGKRLLRDVATAKQRQERKQSRMGPALPKKERLAKERGFSRQERESEEPEKVYEAGKHRPFHLDLVESEEFPKEDLEKAMQQG